MCEPARDKYQADTETGVSSRRLPLAIPKGRELGPTTQQLIEEVRKRNEAARRVSPEQLMKRLTTPPRERRVKQPGVGKPLNYLGCVFCGKSQYLFAPDHPPFSGEIDPLRFKIYQKRVAAGGPGRGNFTKGVGGFKVVDAESETIVQMMRTHPELVAKIKARVLQIVKAYLQAGIIQPREIPVGGLRHRG